MSGPSDENLPAQVLARALLGGEVGLSLLDRLETDFATTSRSDVFLAIALAWTEMQAGLVACEAEIRSLRRELQGLKLPHKRAA
jgi:hypothetical protein